MSPFRWDVLLVGFALAIPVLALGMRGDLTAEEVTNRLLWCLGAGWGAVALVRFAATPRTTTGPTTRPAPRRPQPASEDSAHAPTS